MGLVLARHPGVGWPAQTAQPRPSRPWRQHEAKGHRAIGSSGPRAGVLDPDWSFLTLPPGWGHLRCNDVCHTSLHDLGHPLLSLSWGRGISVCFWGRGGLFWSHSLDCLQESGAVVASGERNRDVGCL